MRRKLGLESGVIVRLKQIRPNMLLDLDDGVFSCVQATLALAHKFCF